MNNKSILIIGGTGFLGFHLCSFFKKKWRVFSLSQRPPAKNTEKLKRSSIYLEIFQI